MHKTLRVNAPEVINETIDGESVMINLRTGTYYSLSGTGAEVWAAIEATTTVDHVVDELASRHDAPVERIRADVVVLVDQLADEGLVLVHDAAEPPLRSSALAPAAGRAPYSPPILERFTDMQDLILLDPVHEVDHQAWPQAVGGAQELS